MGVKHPPCILRRGLMWRDNKDGWSNIWERLGGALKVRAPAELHALSTLKPGCHSYQLFVKVDDLHGARFLTQCGRLPVLDKLSPTLLRMETAMPKTKESSQFPCNVLRVSTSKKWHMNEGMFCIMNVFCEDISEYIFPRHVSVYFFTDEVFGIFLIYISHMTYFKKKKKRAASGGHIRTM